MATSKKEQVEAIRQALTALQEAVEALDNNVTLQLYAHSGPGAGCSIGRDTIRRLEVRAEERTAY